MSIQIDVARICGFRGIANIEITLPKVTVLFGQNNAGKTSIIKALQLALGDYSRYLSDEDFYIIVLNSAPNFYPFEIGKFLVIKTQLFAVFFF